MIVVTLEELERRIDARKAELGWTGNDYVRRNSGERRTPEKRALLAAMKRVDDELGRPSPFDPKP